MSFCTRLHRRNGARAERSLRTAPESRHGPVAWFFRQARPLSDQADQQCMKGPGQQPCEPAPDPVLAAMDAAGLFRAGDDRNAIATLLLADEPLLVAVAACMLLGDALAGLDWLNGTVVRDQP